MESLDLTDFSQLLRSGAGLIIGPSQTIDGGCLAQMAQALRTKFGVTGDGTYLTIGSAAVVSGALEKDVRQELHELLKKLNSSPALTTLASVKWSAVLSLSLDTNFDIKLQQEFDRKAARRRTYTVISELAAPLPPGTVPIFKLLGNMYREDFPVTRMQYVQRRGLWRHAIPTFSELARGNPVVCIGLSGLESILEDLFGEMIADPTSAPSYIIFLADDPLTQNSELQALLTGRTRVRSVRASLSDLLRSLNKAADSGYASSLPFGSSYDNPYQPIDSSSDIICVVNRQLTPRASATEGLLLREILFSPSTPRWDPFAHNLDFARSLSKEIFQEVSQFQKQCPEDEYACIIHGGAASGKTTLLKRLAFDLAAEGSLVLWQKPCLLPDPTRQLKALFADILKVPKQQRARMVYVFDDPFSCGSFTPELIASFARTNGIPLTLLIGIRTTDLENSEGTSLVTSMSFINTHHLEDQLTPSELKELPTYLVTLGICDTLDSAQKRCSVTQANSARDTLSMLYWLLPQTRGSIASSIRDEFFRLGDVAGLRSIILGTESHSTQLLRDAYEMVAVADNFKVPLPVEVLVSALGVDYGPWLEATKPGTSSAWGILYCDGSEEESTYYRTRNALVTELLIETINGGMSGHSGELRVLAKLVSACHGRTTPVYREFCVRLLVPYSKIERLNYLEGLRLYDEAISALPHPDRTLVHHKGLWIKNVGNDPVNAAEVLSEALRTPVYPYTTREESNEHIHTSMAATLLDGIDDGTISLQDGKNRALDHLAKARASDYFSPRAVHVHASLAVRLVKKIEGEQRPDAFAVVSNALADVDSSLLLLQSPISTGRSTRDEVEALEQVRGKLFMAISHSEELEKEADVLWESFQSQEGFIVMARKELENARQKNKGSQFKKAYDYCLSVRRRIEDKGVDVSPRLSEVQLLIYYTWNVIRSIVSPQQTHIDWVLLKDLVVETLHDPSLSRNHQYRFIYALASAHLGEWNKANLEFQQMRQSSLPTDILWKPRALLLNESGGPRLVQGVIRESAERRLFHVHEFLNDFYCDRRGDWGRDGETSHGFMQFAFAGATIIEKLN